MWWLWFVVCIFYICVFFLFHSLEGMLVLVLSFYEYKYFLWIGGMFFLWSEGDCDCIL